MSDNTAAIQDLTELHELGARTGADSNARPPLNPRLRSALTGLKSMAIGASGFALILALWQAMAHFVGQDLPGPIATFQELWRLISNPFYDAGPNDKGIGLLTGYSLLRVASGWLLGSLVAIPIGILLGSTPLAKKAIAPVVEIMRPVSPLAWFPIGMAVLKSAPNAAIFAVFMTSLWPTLINTTFGVASLPDDYKNVARVFQFSRGKYVRRILLPYALPHIITGLRLSMGIAWMVIVAAEMLSAVPGIGGFVWDSWNSLMLTRVISAILIIGIIGLGLDRGFDRLHKKYAYGA
jgi:nitrate/nitrite transport system permease protein